MGQEAIGVIQNNTDFDLTLKDHGLNSGSFGMPPLSLIPKRASQQTIFIAMGSVFMGTQGWMRYMPVGQGIPNGVTVTLAFSDPFTGHNDTNGTTSSSPHFTVDGDVPRSGSDVRFTYTVDYKP